MHLEVSNEARREKFILEMELKMRTEWCCVELSKASWNAFSADTGMQIILFSKQKKIY